MALENRTLDGTNAIENHSYTQNQSYSVTLTLTNACGSVDSTFTVNVTSIGFEEMELSHSLNVFPNPTNGAFSIKFNLDQSSETNIKVMDAFGRLGELNKLGNLNREQNISLNLEGNASGIYYILIGTDSGVVSRRVILKSK